MSVLMFWIIGVEKKGQNNFNINGKTYESDEGGRCCQRSETQHCDVRVNKCKYIFTWSHVGAAQSPPPRETRQPVPPGAL